MIATFNTTPQNTPHFRTFALFTALFNLKTRHMKTLTETLTQLFKTQRLQFIDMTEKWAVKDFDRLRQFAADYRAGVFGFDGDEAKTYHRLPNYIVNPNGKVEQHIDKMIKAAVKHFEQSIEKLADRIKAKGLNEDKIQVWTSYININIEATTIEATITDGDKTLKAFTIVAEGNVQRPHYRYLIK